MQEQKSFVLTVTLCLGALISIGCGAAAALTGHWVASVLLTVVAYCCIHLAMTERGGADELD